MKLSTASIAKTLTQFEAQAIPDNHPVVAQLSTLFGEHTFFLNNEGLNIVEPAEMPEFEPAHGAGHQAGGMAGRRPREPGAARAGADRRRRGH